MLTAAAAGVTSGTQTVTVTPGALASVVVSPKSAMVRTRADGLSSRRSARDAYGNTVPVSAAWSLTPPIYGTLAPRTGPDDHAHHPASDGRGLRHRHRRRALRHRGRARQSEPTADRFDHVSTPLALRARHRECRRLGRPADLARRDLRARPARGDRRYLHGASDDRCGGQDRLSRCPCEPPAATRRRFGQSPHPASPGTAAPPAIGSADPPGRLIATTDRTRAATAHAERYEVVTPA